MPQGGFNGGQVTTHDGQRAQDNLMAKAALGLGIAAIFCAGVTSPFALALGNMAKKQCEAEPGKYRNEKHASYAVRLGLAGCGLLVFGLLGRFASASNDSADAPAPPPLPTIAASPNQDEAGDAIPAPSGHGGLPTSAAGPATNGTPPSSAAASRVVAQAQTPEDIKFEEYLANATPIGEFKIPIEDNWALLPSGTTECGKDYDGNVQRLDEPDGADEFEIRRKKAGRDALKAKYVGRLLVASGTGEWGNDGFDLGEQYQASLSKYDFSKHRYNIRVSGQQGSEVWPIGDKPVPKIMTEAMYTTTSRKIGAIEGFLFDRDISVDVREREVDYLNGSSMTVPVSISEADAEQFRRTPATVEVLLEYRGMGYHKVCRNECMTMLGSTVCGAENVGLGEHHVAQTVGWRIRSQQATIAVKIRSGRTATK